MARSKQLQNIFEQLDKIERKTVVCTVSGGLDSAVAAAIFAEAGFKLHFVFFDWGQKTYIKELESAEALAKHYNADLKKYEVLMLKNLPGISLTSQETLTTAVNEYVPNRNAILETQAVALAEYLKAGVLCIGSTGGDTIAPDNSPKFINKMQGLIEEGTMLKPTIKIIAPLMKTDKTGAVALGTELEVPFELTWSCHNELERACGKCSNCESRFQAFKENSLEDPIPYKEINA